MLGSRWYGYLLTAAIAFTGFQIGWSAAQGRTTTALTAIVILAVIIVGSINHIWRLIAIIEDTARSEGHHEAVNLRFADLEDRISDLRPDSGD